MPPPRELSPEAIADILAESPAHGGAGQASKVAKQHGISASRVNRLWKTLAAAPEPTRQLIADMRRTANFEVNVPAAMRAEVAKPGRAARAAKATPAPADDDAASVASTMRTAADTEDETLAEAQTLADRLRVVEAAIAAQGGARAAYPALIEERAELRAELRAENAASKKRAAPKKRAPPKREIVRESYSYDGSSYEYEDAECDYGTSPAPYRRGLPDDNVFAGPRAVGSRGALRGYDGGADGVLDGEAQGGFVPDRLRAPASRGGRGSSGSCGWRGRRDGSSPWSRDDGRGGGRRGRWRRDGLGHSRQLRMGLQAAEESFESTEGVPPPPSLLAAQTPRAAPPTMPTTPFDPRTLYG